MLSRYALICGERVIDIVEGERRYEIGGELAWVAAPQGVTRDCLFQGGAFVMREQNAVHAELEQLDRVLPRALEDLIAALGTEEERLPQIMRVRLARKRELRASLQASAANS